MRFTACMVSAFILAAAAPLWAAGPSEIEACDQSADQPRRAAACSRVIADSAQDAAARAVAYNNRGNVFRRTGDNDRAIADYDEAIKLRPEGTYFYNRGNAYRAKGDNDRAIADYSEAIRLNPNDGSALQNRGNAFRDRGDIDRAIADYDKAIALGATAVRFYSRGEAYRIKGDYPRAIADYDEAIAREPRRAVYYFDRGRAYFYGASLDRAQADFTRANELAPEHPYGALWREIGERRNKSQTSLARTMAQLDMSAWPAPIIRLFLGEVSAEAVLGAAEDPDPQKKGVHVCEAHFYIGELLLLRGAKDQATQEFHRVANECRQTVVEWDGANVELKNAGIGP